MSRATFVSFFEQGSFPLAIDLRVLPSFNFESFSRQAAFKLFERYSINYVDLGTSLGVNVVRSSNMDGSTIAEQINSHLALLGSTLNALMLFLDATQIRAWEELELEQRLRARSSSGWERAVVQANF